jgi:hypothetical protein
MVPISAQAPIPLEPGRFVDGQPVGLFYRVDVDFFGHAPCGHKDVALPAGEPD